MSDDTRTIPVAAHIDPGKLTLTGETAAWIEREVLPRFLPGRRWYAEKTAAIEATRIVDTIEFDGSDGALLAIVEIEPTHALYFVPIAKRSSAADDEFQHAVLARLGVPGREVDLVDALMLGDAPRAVLADIRAQVRRRARNGGTFAAHATATLQSRDVPAEPAIRRLSVEQSNTSIVLGEDIMLKAYRRIHRGPQAELEVARFLDAVGYENTPALLGFVEYEEPGKEPAAVCIVQSFAKNRGDGWAVTLAHLASGADNPQAMEEAAFTGFASTLGRRTAELHRAFATSIGDPAFEPERVTDSDVAAWVTQARATAEEAFGSLARGIERIPADVRAVAESLLGRRTEIAARFDIPPLGARSFTKTRYHGDFHLGQVLVVDDDVMIVDFEGEPGRDPAVRRQKSSPLRDVAGMLRSIDYASVAGQSPPGWERRIAAAFLEGYRETITGTSSYPSDASMAQRLLDLFILEKACYELSYELANRPAWVRIPLQGIRTIVDADEHARITH